MTRVLIRVRNRPPQGRHRTGFGRETNESLVCVLSKNAGLRRPLWVLVVQKRSDWMRRKVGKVAMRDYFWARLCPHRRHEGLDAHDVHNAGEIVSQYVQRHL